MGEGHDDGVHPKAKAELLQSTIEIITGICQNVAEARADLAATLAEVTEYTARRDLLLMCAGTHPFSDPVHQEITPNDRYRRLVEEMQWPARQMQIFGIHVHVGVRSAEKAIAMVNALSAYIPHFLALSASSPYWMGQDTGLGLDALQGVRGPAHRGPAVAAVRLGAVRAVHGHAHRRADDRHHPRGVVGHPPPPRLRHGRAAHLRRASHPSRGRRGGRAQPVPGAPLRHAARPRLHAAHPQGVGGAREQVARGPPRHRRLDHRRRRGHHRADARRASPSSSRS